MPEHVPLIAPLEDERRPDDEHARERKGPSAEALGRQAGPLLDALAAADPTTLEQPEARHPYTRITGEPFIRGEGDATDVDQNDPEQWLSDCWFTAAMAALARAEPAAIRRLIKDNRDGTYDVTLYVPDGRSRKKQARVFRVDGQAPTKEGRYIAATSDDAAGGLRELWPTLLEKAFAVYSGSYDALGGKVPFNAGLEMLLPADAPVRRSWQYSADRLLSELAKAVEEGRPIVAACFFRGERERSWTVAAGIISSHAYYVGAVDLGARTIELRDNITMPNRPISAEEWKAIIPQFTISDRVDR